MEKDLGFQTRNRTLVLLIPYSDSDHVEWSNEDIKVKVDIPSLLQMILPVGCLNDDNCCAVKYAQQDEARVREAKARELLNLPAPTKQAASLQDDWDAMCMAGYEGCF